MLFGSSDLSRVTSHVCFPSCVDYRKICLLSRNLNRGAVGSQAFARKIVNGFLPFWKGWRSVVIVCNHQTSLGLRRRRCQHIKIPTTSMFLVDLAMLMKRFRKTLKSLLSCKPSLASSRLQTFTATSCKSVNSGKTWESHDWRMRPINHSFLFSIRVEW